MRAIEGADWQNGGQRSSHSLNACCDMMELFSLLHKILICKKLHAMIFQIKCSVTAEVCVGRGESARKHDEVWNAQRQVVRRQQIRCGKLAVGQ